MEDINQNKKQAAEKKLATGAIIKMEDLVSLGFKYISSFGSDSEVWRNQELSILITRHQDISEQNFLEIRYSIDTILGDSSKH